MNHHREIRDQLRAQGMAQAVDSMFGWQVQVTKSNVRVGDAERDAAAHQLGEHFANGRLERWEYDERLDAVLAARTRGDLARVFRDLPGAGVPAPRPVSPPVRRRRGFRLPMFPMLLILVGLAVVLDTWWVFVIGFGVVLLARRAGRRPSTCQPGWRAPA